MVLLAIDTSGKNGSLALARLPDKGGEIAVLEVVPLVGGTFSAQLVPQIAALLDKHGFTKADIAGFAVASGPGSFTGLRVGLAAVKALAEVLQAPIAAISLLEAVAHSAEIAGPVLSVLDAGRGQLYVGLYDGTPLQMQTERLLSREELAAEARERVIVTPDPQLADDVRAAGFQVAVAPYPRSDVIARLGWKRILRHETVSPEALEANYIRRSDAEIFSLPKH
ncbi:MAG TPA: tRNA (adenosine(37)-N6)-threonylcarbamoyltransferase complex dimerization subunit type 1 TsaB [Terriglobales bacterium]|nr:tRNA (adenosine(37)-N6)-threonylcarbamoyltransferase complex dimerization subunit type 1 TsaB [Terriglobales bacterium]